MDTKHGYDITPNQPLPRPDIGADPLKVGDFDIEKAMERLSKGAALQQLGVPDQTMLAWRIDVSRVQGELIWRRACMEAAKDKTGRIVKMIEALKKISNSELSAGECREIARAALE